MMKQKNTTLLLGTTLLIAVTFLSGCSSFFLGKENLSEPVDLSSKTENVTLSTHWNNTVSDGTGDKSLKLSPLVTANNIFAVSADGQLVSYDKVSGSRNWRKKIGHSIAAGVSGNDNTIVVGSENGLLMAFSSHDGQPLWHYQLSTEIVAQATVAADLVVARTIDGQVTALSERNGQVVWKQSLSVANLSIRGNAKALFLDGTLLYTTGKGRLSLLSMRDGNPVLDESVSRGRGNTAVERVADLLATPVIRNGVLFLSAYRQETLAIKLSDGTLLWKSDKATALDLFADNRYVYIVDKNSVVYALDMRTGKVAWQSNVIEGRNISPLSGNGAYLVTVDNEGMLIVINSNDGELLSYHNVGDERTYIAPQWVDGKWLTFTGNGRLTLSEISQ